MGVGGGGWQWGVKKRTELPGDRLQLADAIEDQSTAHLARHCNLRQNYTMPVLLLFVSAYFSSRAPTLVGSLIGLRPYLS